MIFMKKIKKAKGNQNEYKSNLNKKKVKINQKVKKAQCTLYKA